MSARLRDVGKYQFHSEQGPPRCHDLLSINVDRNAQKVMMFTRVSCPNDHDVFAVIIICSSVFR